MYIIKDKKEKSSVYSVAFPIRDYRYHYLFTQGSISSHAAGYDEPYRQHINTSFRSACRTVLNPSVVALNQLEPTAANIGY